MKTSDVIQLDCREEENKNIIQRVLRKIKPLARCSEEPIPLEMLERCIQVLCRKYDYSISLHMDPSSNAQFPIFRCHVVMHDKKMVSGTNVFGCSIYEVIAKAIILAYSKAKGTGK